MKTLKSGTLALMLCALMCKVNAQTAIAPSGAGTESNPYLISTLNHLYWVTQNSSEWAAGKYFLQTASIDATTTATWDAGKGFFPIGSMVNQFRGTYDGGGFDIVKLTINRPTSQYQSLFGYLNSSATVRNLTMTTPSISAWWSAEGGDSHAGGMVGVNAGTVSNCHTRGGSILGRQHVGGLVGTNYSRIENSSSTANVSGDAWVAGIAGYTGGYGSIKNCFSSGVISAAASGTRRWQIGGLVGTLEGHNTRMENCYTSASVSGIRYIGGAVGFVTSAQMINCYSRGSVSGATSDMGGFVGYSQSTPTYTRCYWDTQTSGRSASAGGSGRTSAQMKTLSNYNGWDFMCETTYGTADIWVYRTSVNSSYPTLAWEGGYSDNCNAWLGTNNTSWSQANNWSLNTVPADGAEVLIASAAVADLHLDRTRNVSRIVFPSTGTRKVVLGNYDLTIDSSSAGYTNAYVQTNGTGRLHANIANGATYRFPVGTTSFTPITISNHTGANDIFSVGIFNGVKSAGTSGENYNEGGHVSRTWDIHKQNPNAGNGISMRLTWNAGDVSGLFTSPVLFHYGSKWERLRGTFTFSPTALTYNNYTGGFSPFAILDATTTLPVNWGNVSAQKDQNNVLVKWATLTEDQTDFYQVQHSTDGRNWQNIGARVAAAGNSNTARSYQLVHEQPVNGNNYYRVLQQDIDGRQSFSKIVSVQTSDNKAVFNVYPNPTANGQVNLTTSVAGTLQVYNGMGSLVKTVKMQTGNNAVDLSSLPKGVYRLKLGNESASLLIK